MREGCGACACQSQYLANGLHILNIGKGRGGKGERGAGAGRQAAECEN